MPSMFGAAIPGQSLTREPGNAPWEQPPQYPKVEDALDMYMDRLEEEDVQDKILFLLERKMPLDVIVNTFLMTGEMKGKHTPDVSLLIGPVMHEFVKGLADAAEIDYQEFQGLTPKEKKEQQDQEFFMMMLEDAEEEFGRELGVLDDIEHSIEEVLDEEEEPAIAPVKTDDPVLEEEQEQIEEELPEEELPPVGGLMSRRN